MSDFGLGTREDVFISYHPAVNLLYFTAVMGYAMSFANPLCLAISLVCASAYSLYVNGKKAARFALVYMLPMLVFTALINPAFNHRGVTILAYFPSGNPLTLESILYGIAAATMLVTALFWFGRFNAVITSDKLIYLFGSLAPALSLVLTMSLRLVPRYRARLDVIRDARAAAGPGAGPHTVPHAGRGSLAARLRGAVKTRSILITWALENAIETADSMKARGYGLPGRTAFSIYRFDARDKKALLYIIACAAFVAAGAMAGAYSFRYFPSIKGGWGGAHAVIAYAAYLMLCAFPLIINIMDDLLWKSIESKI